MKKYPITIGILFFVFSCFSFSDDDNCHQAQLIIQKIRNLAINNQIDSALSLADTCIQICPSEIKYKFEKALLFYQQQNFDSSEAILLPLIDDPQANDEVFQILGICYEMTRHSPKAEEIYLKGLKKFPDSGKLYCELGTFYQADKKAKEVIKFWEKGIQVEPSYAMNYYPLSIYYSNGGEKLWSLIYSEIYLNISQNNAKSKEISKKLLDTYNSGLNNKENGVLFPKFTDYNPRTLIRNIDSIKVNFEGACFLVMKDALVNYELKDSTTYTIKQISDIRTDFINLWYKYGFNKKYSNALFDFNHDLISEGLFEAYNYLILKEGNNAEFQQWYSIKFNKIKMEKLINFMGTSGLTLNSDNYVSRFKGELLAPVNMDK